MTKNRRMMSALRGQQVSSHAMNGTLTLGIALGMRVSHGSLYRPLHAYFDSQDHGLLCMQSVFPIAISLAVTHNLYIAYSARGKAPSDDRKTAQRLSS
jgi:hypothetical protein